MSVVPVPEDVRIDVLHPRVRSLFRRKQWAQRTEEWYAVRQGLMTASEAAGALGVKPFKSFKGDPREELLQKKLNNAPVRGMALEHGVKYEIEAADLAMRVLGERMFEFGLLVHDDYPWLAASPDGITSRGFAVEIKCPLRRQIVPGEVPHHYFPQIQVQMEVCNLDFCYFIQYKPGFMTEDGSPFIDIAVVERDRQWFADNRDSLHEFWKELMERRETHVPVDASTLGMEIHDALYETPGAKYEREFESSEEFYDTTAVAPSEASECIVEDHLYLI